MGKLSLTIIVFMLAVLLGGGAFLATWDIPAPSSAVERTIPDDRFPR